MDKQLKAVIEGMIRGLKQQVGMLENILDGMKSGSTSISVTIENIDLEEVKKEIKSNKNYFGSLGL